MSLGIHIVALGARTPVGLGAESSAAAVRAGISRIREHPFLVAANGEMVPAALDCGLEPTLLGWPRVAEMVAAALAEVLNKLGPASKYIRGIPLLLALPDVRPGFGDTDTQRCLTAISQVGLARQIDLQVERVATGHAGALRALEYAARKLTTGMWQMCLVGGADSYFESDTIEWLESDRRLAGDDVRGGLIPGEGAAILLLMTDAARRKFGLRSLAILRAICTAAETRLINGEQDGLGDGLTEAITGATACLSLPREAVDAVYCDINGERYRTEEWGFALLRTHRAFRVGSYETPVDCWGDTGAASAVLSCVLAAQSWARHYAPGPRALVWASSDNGLRGAAVLEQGEV
jgi:3-oxoacyl-[acyl-carrier-protein] synthase I